MAERGRGIGSQQHVIGEFRASGGHVGGYFSHMSLLVLTTIGVRSGRPRAVPLTFLADGDAYVVIAANAGAERHPDWYFNLRAHPDALVEHGDRTVEVTAEIVEDDRRDSLLQAFTAENPQVALYQAGTTRRFPVIRLAPR